MSEISNPVLHAGMMTPMTTSAVVGSISGLEKFLQKPSNYDGSPSSWMTWSFQFENFLAVVDENFATEVPAVTGAAAELTIESMSQEQRKRSVTLYSLLAGLLQGRALVILKTLQKSRNGYEAYRLLAQEAQPRTHNRHLALLMNVTNGQILVKGSEPFMDRLLVWESMVTEYEVMSGTTLSDEIKKAVLIKGLPSNVQQQIIYNIAKYPTYATIRDALTMMHDSARAWHTASTGTVEATAHSPMDIGAVHDKGKGKSKGTFKGKDKAKGKDKHNYGKGYTGGPSGKPSGRDGGCFTCGSTGHMAKDCPK